MIHLHWQMGLTEAEWDFLTCSSHWNLKQSLKCCCCGGGQGTPTNSTTREVEICSSGGGGELIYPRAPVKTETCISNTVPYRDVLTECRTTWVIQSQLGVSLLLAMLIWAEIIFLGTFVMPTHDVRSLFCGTWGFHSVLPAEEKVIWGGWYWTDGKEVAACSNHSCIQDCHSKLLNCRWNKHLHWISEMTIRLCKAVVAPGDRREGGREEQWFIWPIGVQVRGKQCSWPIREVCSFSNSSMRGQRA